MAIGYASVRVNITNFVVDGIDSDDLPDDQPLTAILSLTPMIQAGRTLQYRDGSVQKLKAVSAFSVAIGPTGDISHQGRDYVKVVAPTIKETNLARLQWRADFSDIRMGGSATSVRIDPIYFWVDPDAEINLADHVNVAASTAVIISRGARGHGVTGAFTNVDGDLVIEFETDDGTAESEPISLSNALTDGTVSALITDADTTTRKKLDADYAPKAGLGNMVAAEVENPETALNSAILALTGGVIPSGVMPFVNAMADLATARPAGYSGPVTWVLPVGTSEPVHKQLGDLYLRATETVIAWSPAQVPNVYGWWDAATIGGSARALSQWSDSSGNLRHGKQETPGAQPYFDPTGMGGKPCITFNGTSQWFLTDAFTPSVQEAFTLYVVADSALDKPVSSSDVIIDGLNATANTPLKLAYYRTSANVATASRGTGLTQSGWTPGIHRHTVVFNGINSSIQIDNGTITRGTTNITDVQIDKLSLGARADGQSFWEGSLAEILLVRGAVSEAHHALIVAYLQDKWAVA